MLTKLDWVAQRFREFLSARQRLWQRTAVADVSSWYRPWSLPLPVVTSCTITMRVSP